MSTCWKSPLSWHDLLDWSSSLLCKPAAPLKRYWCDGFCRSVRGYQTGITGCTGVARVVFHLAGMLSRRNRRESSFNRVDEALLSVDSYQISAESPIELPCPMLCRQGRASPQRARIVGPRKPGSHPGGHRSLRRITRCTWRAARRWLRFSLSIGGGHVLLDNSQEVRRLHILIDGLGWLDTFRLVMIKN